MPSYDVIHLYWFKRFISINERLAIEMNRYLQETDIPEWMTKVKTTLIQNDPQKGAAPDNLKPIKCLPMIWKILTAQISEEIYNSLISSDYSPYEQKGCCKETRGTGELLYIDQHILKDIKTRRSNLAMAWIDSKKAYDMVPQRWITDCLKTYKISGEVIKFIENNMKNWRVELTAEGKSLTKVKIQIGAF